MAIILINKLGKAKVDKFVLGLLGVLFYALSGFEGLFFLIKFIILAFMTGVLISKAKNNTLKKAIIIVYTTAVLITLLFYKCAPFNAMQITQRSILLNQEVSPTVTVLSNIMAPAGISFISFSMLSYAIDIYRKKAKAGNLVDVLVYITLFPKVLSGPIIQWKDFQPQLANREINEERIRSGIDRIIIGYAKKVIIADTLGAQLYLINMEINTVGVDTPTMWIRAILFFFQLYYDFAGYSDIAIGMCNIMGFSIGENFNFPYLSKSVSEFWRRWHISLGLWFREYLYIPLGGSRKGNVYIHLLVVFLVTGLWHGANGTYIVWGLANGIVVAIEHGIRKKAGIP